MFLDFEEMFSPLISLASLTTGRYILRFVHYAHYIRYEKSLQNQKISDIKGFCDITKVKKVKSAIS